MNQQLTLDSNGPEMSKLLTRLSAANREFTAIYPGDSIQRQPVHTVYGGAHLFKADSVARLGALARQAMADYAPDAASLAAVLEFSDPWLAQTVYDRVTDKLQREAVEDFRIDFEDGFGVRSDEEEDAVAVQAAQETARGMQQQSLPPYIGIRIKMFSEELRNRAIRTLDLFVSTLVRESGGRLPDNFVVTLPKVTIPEQVEALVGIFDLLEARLGLAAGSLKMEFMIETTQSVIGSDGRSAIPAFARAARGRCTGAHFGTYDFTASSAITAAYQTMIHPGCDFAKQVMKLSLEGTGIWLSDGATNIMPVGPHRADAQGSPLTPLQIAENHKVVHAAWKTSYDHIRHSLYTAYYQGWDLHPAQFPIRYAACYAFFLEGFAQASDRLRNFIEKAAKATLTSNVFDDAATGQGLLNYFLRALNCGAITEQEVLQTGLSLEEIQLRSFAKIIEGRSKRA